MSVCIFSSRLFYILFMFCGILTSRQSAYSLQVCLSVLCSRPFHCTCQHACPPPPACKPLDMTDCLPASYRTVVFSAFTCFFPLSYCQDPWPQPTMVKVSSFCLTYLNCMKNSQKVCSYCHEKTLLTLSGPQPRRRI